jgi:multiple sugar transport system permease protein
MSLYRWRLFDLGRARDFVGLENYIRIFSDAMFLNAAKNTFLIVAVCLIVEIVLGFLIALVLWNMQKSLRVVHAIIMLPMITSPVIVALIWRFMFDPQFGIINYVLRAGFGITGIAWLADVNLALPSVMIMDIWQMTPFVILILYASMTTIPNDCIESAFVDGASFWKMVYRIFIPFILPAILLVMILRIMDLFRIFDTIFVLTRGGPGSATESLSIYIYRTSFQFHEMGYAMALSLVTLLCILLVSIGYIGARRARD